MWYPFRKATPKKTVDGAIERYRRARPTRALIGLHIDSAFGSVCGAAVEIRGSGKWMRIRSLGHVRIECNDSLSDGCRHAADGGATAGETVGIGDDLGQFCAEVVDLLLAEAKLSIEDPLAVCVDEPGVRWRDYDGRLESAPLFQPQRFAERTGLSVIDALHAADVATGGQGGPLDPLPLWLLFADRRPPLAHATRWFIQLDEILTITCLPPSDGLDAELPEITRFALPGLGLFDQLDRIRDNDTNAGTDFARVEESLGSGEQLAALAVQGCSQEQLLELLRVESVDWGNTKASPSGMDPMEKTPFDSEQAFLREWMVRVASLLDQAARNEGLPWADVYCSAMAGLVDRIAQVIGMRPDEVSEVILAGRGRRNGLLVSGLGKTDAVTEVAMSDDCGFHSEALPGVCSAVLGMMHVDQMPASLPWLTGCLVPRLHGRVTPGRPVHWRRLVSEMADFHPPAMKLREAV